MASIASDVTNIVFLAKTNNAYTFKVLAELLSTNIKTGHLMLDSNGIKLRMINKGRNVLFDVNLLAGNFSLYKIAMEKIYIGINLIHFHKMLKSIKKKDNIELFINKERTGKLGIRVTPRERDRVTTSYINIQTVQEIEIDLPVVTSNPINISSSDFQKMVKDMTSIGSTLCLKAKRFRVMFSSAPSGVLEREVEFGEHDYTDRTDSVWLDSDFKQTYSTDTILKITKISGLDNTIKIYPNAPLCMKSMIEGFGDIQIFIKSIEQLESEAHDEVK